MQVLLWYCLDLAIEWIHEGLLSDFNSTKPNDPEGNLLVVDNMLKTVNRIICDYNKVYSDIPVDQVNVIKTLINTLLGIVIPCEIKDKIQIANFIASDDTLIEAIILTLGSKGSMYACVYVCTSYEQCVTITFLNQARQPARAWFLRIAPVRECLYACVFVCVCVHPRGY